MQGSNIFTCLDLPSAYWHIPVEESSIEKTAFEIPKGKYEMLRMPFGLCNSQSSQQRPMDNVLDGTKDCEAYVDNIIAYGKGSFIEHLQQIREVFDKLRKANLDLRVDKCIFASRKVTNLGFEFFSEGIKPSEENIVKIKDFPRPKNVKELKRFPGLSNYYRQFMNSFATVAEPLQQLLRKNKEFIWGQSQEKAFNEIKKVILSYPVIGFPNWNKEFLIEMDGKKGDSRCHFTTRR